MINLSIAQTTGTIAVFICIFLSVFLFSVMSKNKLGNILFASFLLIRAIDIGGFLIDDIETLPFQLKLFATSFIFLQIPVFYGYVLAVSYSDFKLKWKHLVHIIPFLIVNLIYVPRLYNLNTSQDIISTLINPNQLIEFRFNHLLFHIQVIVYLILIFRILYKSRKAFLENYASINIKSYKWLSQLTIALAIFYGIALAKNIFKFSAFPVISEGIKTGLLFFELVVVSWYLLKALNHPELFRNISMQLKLVSEILSKENLNADSSEPTKRELGLLEKYMLEEKPYLRPSITIQEMAKEIKIPQRDLSILINHRLNQHFFDFINGYRIEEAMKLLRDPQKKQVTVLEILYEVGFNSKSSFNTAFKKYTGSTPTAYRKHKI